MNKVCKKVKYLEYFYNKKINKDGKHNWCKECMNGSHKEYVNIHSKEINVQNKKYKKTVPWKMTLKLIKQRTNNPNRPDYYRYGGKGIKCRITEKELKILWFRDKAHNMKQPSIDRKNNYGHYEFDNCQFIEMDINSIKNRNKPIIQYSLDGKFIKEWESSTKVSKDLNFSSGNICNCLKGKLKHYNGFIWRYKNEI